jgi:hypothetical protein
MLIAAVYGEELTAGKERLGDHPSQMRTRWLWQPGTPTTSISRRSHTSASQDVAFRDEIAYLGFYKDKAIQREVPRFAIGATMCRSLATRPPICALRAMRQTHSSASRSKTSLDSGPRVEGKPYQVFSTLISTRRVDAAPSSLRGGFWHNADRWQPRARLRPSPRNSIGACSSFEPLCLHA